MKQQSDVIIPSKPL